MDRLIRVRRRAFLSAGVFTAVALSAGSCVSVLQLADAPTTANGGTDVYSIPGLDRNGSHNSGPDLTLGPSDTIIFSPLYRHLWGIIFGAPRRISELDRYSELPI
jgi:hypothetical protein